MWSHKCSCVHTNWETRVECKYIYFESVLYLWIYKKYNNCCSGDTWASCLFSGFFGEDLFLFCWRRNHIFILKQNTEIFWNRNIFQAFFLIRNSNALFSCFSLGNIIFWPWQIDKLMLFCCSRLGFNHKGFQNVQFLWSAIYNHYCEVIKRL